MSGVHPHYDLPIVRMGDTSVRAIQPASSGRRYALAAIAALAAAILQWVVTPAVGQRIPFLFFLIAIVSRAFMPGEGPACSYS
jgi:hypothetical protein